MLTYVSVGWIIRSFYWNTIDQEMAYEVIDGKIAMDLIKPVSVQWMWISRAMGESAFRLILLTLPTAIVVALIFPCRAGFARAFLDFSRSGARQLFPDGRDQLHDRDVRDPAEVDSRADSREILADRIALGPADSDVVFSRQVRKVMAWLPFEHIAYTPLQIYLGKLDLRTRCARWESNGCGWSCCWFWRICGGIAPRSITIHGG